MALGTVSLMARTTITFTMSLPPEMAAELEKTMAREHRTRSELVREALRRYFSANATRESLPSHSVFADEGLASR